MMKVDNLAATILKIFWENLQLELVGQKLYKMQLSAAAAAETALDGENI